MSDLADFLQPIPGLSPSGSNARYHPAFVRLEEHISRLTSLTEATPEWALVASDAALLLTTQSKDLLAAVYLTRAWFELRGLPGLRDGLFVIEDFVTNHWPDGFPSLERLRARRSALQWLSDGLIPRFGRVVSVSDDPVCALTVQRIHDAVRPHFAAGDTGFGGLLRACNRPEANDEGTPSVTSTPLLLSAAAAPAAALRTTLATPLTTDRADALHRLRDIATWFLVHEPHSPVGFLAQRAADLGGQPFHMVFQSLLAQHQPAQQELWQVLGISVPTPTN